MTFVGPLHDLIWALVPEYYVTVGQLWFALLVTTCVAFEIRVWRKYQ